MAPDVAADHMCIDFFRNALPPRLTGKEKAMQPGGSAECRPSLRTQIKLVRDGIVRLVKAESAESDEILLTHTLGNKRNIEENPDDPFSVAFPLEDADALEYIIASYPDWVQVAKIPASSDDIRLDICNALYDEGLILCRPSESFLPKNEKVEREERQKKQREAELAAEAEAKRQRNLERKQSKKRAREHNGDHSD
eukprot:comp11483_c1_seq1/m.14442 comp11483_c1_seq1/g.14442  ORF comp11483_c1_seq1/g.14442 comp11483_c1_seq1/m.14442 type:complete len:196 (-) comp11483_c1_seq1:5-592(-)